MSNKMMSEQELAHLQPGLAYIKVLSTKEAKKLFPDLSGLPRSGKVYLLSASDGTPLALTETRRLAMEHVVEEKWELVLLH